MGKVKKLIGVAAGLALIAWAPPLAGLAATSIGTTTVGSIAARLLTTVAASALMSVVGSKGMSSASGGITLSSTTAGEKTPESLILGWTATGGTLIAPPMTHGDKNSYLTHVVELCSAPGATLERLILNGGYVTLGATPHPQFGRPVLGDLEGLVWVKYYDGSQTAADPHLVTAHGADLDRPWTAAMVGRGICYAILTFRFDREKLTSVPTYRFEMRGIPLYDPRRDSTAGGSGSQRWADPSTWTQTVNNAVMIYNLMRGIPLPGGEVYGGRIAAADLPAATWFAAMNECELPVAKSGGGTEPQYRAGIEVQLSEEPARPIEEFLKACSGKVADVGGAWRIRVGGPGLPVFAMTDDDIIVTREQDFDPFPGLAQAYNAVTATYPDPESIWEPRDAPARTSAELEAQDRFGRKTASLTLSAAPYPMQVQRLMRGWMEAERRFRKHNNSLPPTACGLEPLDVIAWSSARNGYDAKLFDLDQVAEDPATCLVRIASQEVDPNDYSWVPGYELPTSIPAPGLTPPVPLALPDWQCEGIALLDGSGIARRPALKCTWDGDFDRARSIKWEVRLAGATEVSLRGTTEDVAAGAIIIAAGILPAQGYESRGYPNLHNGRGAWSPWMPASTPDVRLAGDDVYLPGQVEEVIERLVEDLKWIRTGTRDLIEQMRSTVLTQAEIDARTYTDKQMMRRELASTRTGVVASFEEAITVATGPNSSLAQRIERLNSRVGEAVAGYKEEITVATGPNSAISQRIEALNAGIADVTAGYQEAIATATGPGSAIAMRLNELTSEIEDVESATASAISGLNTRVDATDGVVEAHADRFDALDVTVGRYSASGLFRVGVEATPSGALSRIGLYASATGREGTGREAALFLEARSGGKSRVLIQADQFAVTNGSARAFPFLFEDGVARMQAAMIGDLSIGRAKIGSHAVTTMAATEGGASVDVPADGDSSYSTLVTLAIEIEEDAILLYGVTYVAELSQVHSSVGTSGILNVRATRNGSLIGGSSANLRGLGVGSARTSTGASGFTRSIAVPVGTQTIRIQAAASAGATNPRLLYPSIFGLIAYR